MNSQVAQAHFHRIEATGGPGASYPKLRGYPDAFGWVDGAVGNCPRERHRDENLDNRRHRYERVRLDIDCVRLAQFTHVQEPTAPQSPKTPRMRSATSSYRDPPPLDTRLWSHRPKPLTAAAPVRTGSACALIGNSGWLILPARGLDRFICAPAGPEVNRA